jgi:hypothetical protein
MENAKERSRLVGIKMAANIQMGRKKWGSHLSEQGPEADF